MNKYSLEAPHGICYIKFEEEGRLCLHRLTCPTTSSDSPNNHDRSERIAGAENHKKTHNLLSNEAVGKSSSGWLIS